MAEEASSHANINSQVIDSIEREEGKPKDSPEATKYDGDPTTDTGYHPPSTEPQTAAFSPSSQSSQNPTKQASLKGGPVLSQDHLKSSSIEIECDVSKHRCNFE